MVAINKKSTSFRKYGMTWIECTKHESIFYDSSENKRCPSCDRDVLRLTAIGWMFLDEEDFEFGDAVLEWIQLGLQAIRATGEMEKEVASKRDTAFQKVKEIQNRTREERKKVLSYMKNYDIFSILKD